MKNRKALIVVDVQYDFMPATEEEYEIGMGGALAVTDGDQIVPVVNELLKKFDLVIFTKDWHPSNMDAFASMHKGKRPFARYKTKQGNEDTLWPAHCLQNSRGADIHEGIDLGLIDGDFYIFKKGIDKDRHPYSGFGAEGLEEFLNEREVEQVFIVGLALDYCVKDTAVDAAMKGFETIVIEDGTKPIDPNINKTLADFQDAGVKIIESWELDMWNLLN